jgi:hypothetical protein
MRYQTALRPDNALIVSRNAFNSGSDMSVIPASIQPTSRLGEAVDIEASLPELCTWRYLQFTYVEQVKSPPFQIHVEAIVPYLTPAPVVRFP